MKLVLSLMEKYAIFNTRVEIPWSDLQVEDLQFVDRLELDGEFQISRMDALGSPFPK